MWKVVKAFLKLKRVSPLLANFLVKAVERLLSFINRLKRRW